MKRWVPVLFWVVVAMAAVVTLGGIIYAFLAAIGPLKTSIFGHPYPAWGLGLFVAFWGSYTLVRLFRLPWKQGSINSHPV